jgi:predicted ester cyclase
MSKGKQQLSKPVQQTDFLSELDGVSNIYSKANVNEITSGGNFNPNDYTDVKGADFFDDPDRLETLDSVGQSFSTKLKNTFVQFGANLASSFGQGIANTLDLVSNYNTLKGMITGSNDNFTSSLFGLSTKDMQDWTENIAKNHQIKEENPGAFDPSDSGWWLNQFASSGTGVGMGLEALATTAAIEGATGGLGSAGALAKLASLAKRAKTMEGAEALLEAAKAAKGFRSAATMYGIISRVSESRMEASNDYKEIYDDLTAQNDKAIKEGKTPQFTEERKQALASAGARKDFYWNLALLPLDILSYRTMVFNPISGSGEGLVEKGLGKVASVYGKSKVGKAAGWLTTHAIGSNIEGIEEGFQNIGEKEGQHYAQVLSGQDDGSSFMQRLGKDVSSAEFWNNYSGGVLGSPIIGGAMSLVNETLHGKSKKAVSDIHSSYIREVGKMDSTLAAIINEYESEGKIKEASILRRQFAANRSLSALHLDAMTDKDTAFDSHMTFMQGTLDELNSGKTDALNDLGYKDVTPEQVETIKKDFTSYIEDANKIKDIYDKVKQQYNKTFVPQITQAHFQLQSLVGQQTEVATKMAAEQTKLFQYDNLTVNGKSVFNAEYKLRALQVEQTRLEKLARNPASAMEQANVNRQLAENKEKINSVEKEVADLNDVENYSEEEKRKDKEIVYSSIIDRDYLQAVYDKERLDNTISLQRKNLALWNNPEYLKEKTQEGIKNAKTQTQANAVASTSTDAKTAEAVKQKNSQIATKEAADEVRQDNTFNNDPLFEDDADDIDNITTTSNNIKDAQGTGENVGDKDFLVGGDGFAFAPNTYDFDKSSPEAKNRIKDSVGNILKRLGDNATFEDLVRQVAKVKGSDTADAIFNSLIYGWEANDKAPVDYGTVYENVFIDPYDDLVAANSQLERQTGEQLEKNNDTITNTILAEQKDPVEFDNNNKPQYKYNGVITNEASAKMAFATKLTHTLVQVDDDDVVVVSHEYVDEGLNQSANIDSLPLLNPDKYVAGDSIVIKVPANFNDIHVPVFDGIGNKVSSMPFGQYVAEKGLTPDMQEYQDKKPMIIYDPNNLNKGLSFVHDVDWYNPVNFNNEFPEDMAEAIANTRSIRSEVLSDTKNHVDGIITGKRQTTFAGLKLKRGNEITLREANPDTILTVAKSDGLVLHQSGTVKLFSDNNNILKNTEAFKAGSIIDVRRYGLEGDRKTFIGFKTIRPNINQQVKTSIIQVATAYASQSTEKSKKIRDAILEATKVDIFNPAGLEIYLNNFINTKSVKVKTNSGDNLNQKIEEAAKVQLTLGTPFIAIEKGQIIFGQSGVTQYINENYKNALMKQGVSAEEATEKAKVRSFFINPKATDSSRAIAALTTKPIVVNGVKYDNILSWYELNMDLDNYNRNVPVIGVDEKGITSVMANSHKDYLLDNLKTNMKSANIGTKEKPLYVSNIQPVVTYDTNKRLQKNTQQPSLQEIKDTIIPQESKAEETKQNVNEDINKKILEDIERAKRELGSDFGKIDDNVAFSPPELTNAQTTTIIEDINRIAGLTPSQQFDITDFMYNQIVPLVNTNGGKVSIEEINKVVDKAFNNVILPAKQLYEERIAHFTKIINDYPDVAANNNLDNLVKTYQYRVNKIQSIQDNYDLLQKEAQRRVDKYTNIKSETVEKDSNEETSDDSTTDEPENNIDFWTDVLTESPENKLTYEMRRFFGQIQKRDKNGQPRTGFLGLPVYEPSDDVIRKLMVTLANVPSDFDTMLSKLETRLNALPWVSDVVARLKASDKVTQNQFVTMMSNTSLRMKFTMISFNRRNNTWNTEVYDTNLSGVADSVMAEWKDNLMFGNLVLQDVEGNHSLNSIVANRLISQFKSWKGLSLKTVSVPEAYWETTVGKIKGNKGVTFRPDGNLAQELQTNLVSNSDRVKFPMKGNDYEIHRLGNGEYQINKLADNIATDKEVRNWLEEFGLTISDQTFKDLKDGKFFHNRERRTWENLFQSGTNTNGLFGILYNKLVYLVNKNNALFDEEGGSPLEDSVINSLANLESKYNDSSTPFGFRDNGKSYFALTMPKFITDRAQELKDPDNELLEQLHEVSFSKNSLWLNLLRIPDNTRIAIKDLQNKIAIEANDEQKKILQDKVDALYQNTFRDKFNVAHIGANAFKEAGKKIFRDNGITKLADLDHELTKLGMFWSMKQGEFKDKTTGLSTLADTGIQLRMATMFSPTMSDKQMMTLITTVVLNLKNADLLSGKGMSDDLKKVLYQQLVKPELMRMTKFHQLGSKTNITAYDKGASLFNFLPEMNNIEFKPGVKLIDAIKGEPNIFTTQYIESNKTLMENIHSTIDKYIQSLTDEKLDVWQKNGIINYNKDDASKTELKFFDNSYINTSGKFTGDNNDKVRMAAMDYVINYLVSNANSFMTMIGDPALFYKENKRKDENGQIRANTTLEKLEDTFINVGKRLAAQIAPGTPIANSQKEKYIQVFLQDRKGVVANNIAYLEELLGVEGAKAYRNIDASDAQEYTTWKEHLHILEQLGKTPDALMNITPQEIEEARSIFASGASKQSLTEKQRKLITKVMQPIKPVYTGQLYDKDQDVMRTMYIKSSSFPLIPQLTEGFEIDKLRLAMQALEDKHNKFVRASYQSANKAGALNIGDKSIWDESGNINQEVLDGLENNMLTLNRKDFRIQQEVPFKTGKNSEDKITLGTQLMKLLFGDEILNYGGFMLNGIEYDGKALHKIYNDTFLDLIKEKRQQLFSELGLDKIGNPIDAQKSAEKVHKLLKDEAEKRGYPLQDIQALGLKAKVDEQGAVTDYEFNLPLWASSNSNRYESMLNAIVNNRMVRMKMPGNSYVAGSEEGFKKTIVEEGSSKVDQSKMIYTSAWNGRELMATTNEDGTIKSAQIFIASKFRDNEGNLIDLFTKENGNYKYVEKTDTGFILKTTMFDSELLKLLSFRIPTSGLQSGSRIEIAGFIPHQNADLIIVPKNFTKQKGLDFDVDKENAYQLWHYMTDDGKFEVLSEKHRGLILAKAESEKMNNAALVKLRDEYNEATTPTAKRYVAKKIREELATQKFTSALLDDLSYDEDDIADTNNTKLNSKITEKLLQNKIVKINQAIYANPNLEIQAKIAKTLNTDFAEEEANYISELTNSTKDKTYWTPLSDEYQKQKMMAGASGKIGTGAYSLDVVGHSLFQQANINGKPIKFTIVEKDEEGRSKVSNKVWKFGDVSSTGILGGTTTLGPNGIAGDRTISEVMSERQNIAVDNEKLQVMGVVNLNDITMDVDKVFNMLGFDKGEDGHNISFLFLSQPIIKDYVSAMKNANANMASEFSTNKEADVVEELIAKYGGEEDIAQDGIKEDYEDITSKLMTNTNFKNNIKGEVSNQLQRAVLRRFLDMKNYGIALRGIQTTINTDSKGLGKSFFDVIERRIALNKLGSNSELVSGASGLIGEYKSKEFMNQDAIKQYLNQGYIDIGDFLVNPDTLTGGFNINGVITAYNLWTKYLPYDARVTNMAFKEILPIIGNGDNMNTSKVIQLKQEVLKHLKKYLSASDRNGIVSNGDDVNEERRRLYIDSENNTSLALYTKMLKNTINDPVVDEFIKTNKLLNRFEFGLNKNGQPSLIKFNNASGEEFDEQYLYESLSTLIENGDKVLPITKKEFKDGKIVEKQYTLASYAQDLIAYTMLANSTQEAIQFSKYIPVSYLNAVTYSAKMRLANTWLHSENDSNILGPKIKIDNAEDTTNDHFISDFAMQMIQHNPERVKAKLKYKDLKTTVVPVEGSTFKDLKNFIPKSPERPAFYSIYNPTTPKGQKKFDLYWFDGKKYTKIPVLGTFGMDEYQPRQGIGKSLVNGREMITPSTQASGWNTVDTKSETLDGDNFAVNDEDLNKVLENIATADISGTSDIAKALSPFVGNTKIKYQDSVAVTVNGEERVITTFAAIYFAPTDTIILNNNLLKTDAQYQAKIILHEVVHALTKKHVQQFISSVDKNGEITLKHTAPAYISSLVRLYNDVRAKTSISNSRAAQVLKEVREGKGLIKAEGETNEDVLNAYALSDIDEFMAHSLTEPSFQKYLASEEFRQSGQTLLDKFKEIITKVLSVIGVKFGDETATTHAIDSIFTIIERANENVKKVNPSQQQADIAYNEEAVYDDSKIPPDIGVSEEDYRDYNDDFVEGEDSEFNAYPDKALVINTNKCM